MSWKAIAVSRSPADRRLSISVVNHCLNIRVSGGLLGELGWKLSDKVAVQFGDGEDAGKIRIVPPLENRYFNRAIQKSGGRALCGRIVVPKFPGAPNRFARADVKFVRRGGGLEFGAPWGMTGPTIQGFVDPRGRKHRVASPAVERDVAAVVALLESDAQPLPPRICPVHGSEFQPGGCPLCSDELNEERVRLGIAPPILAVPKVGGRPTNMWPPEKIAELQVLRIDEGLSIDQIADKWGPPYTRSMVGAKINRLRLHGGPKKGAGKSYLAEISAKYDPDHKAGGGTHGSPELDADAVKIAALGGDPGPTLEDDDSPIEAAIAWRCARGDTIADLGNGHYRINGSGAISQKDFLLRTNRVRVEAGEKPFPIGNGPPLTEE